VHRFRTGRPSAEVSAARVKGFCNTRQHRPRRWQCRGRRPAGARPCRASYLVFLP